MTELGIILDFNYEIKLPMWNIEVLPTSNKTALSYNTCLANKYEPRRTELATQPVVKLLDAKYEKANLPEIIQNNCSHLSPIKQEKLLGVLRDGASVGGAQSNAINLIPKVILYRFPTYIDHKKTATPQQLPKIPQPWWPSYLPL